ncbi:MAG: ADP compounds hydrolase NudE [Candidatus Symbiodolus clandestinus]
MDKTLIPPVILSVEAIAQSQLFTIESVALRFSNGQKRQFERLRPTGARAVMVVAIDNQELLLIREYAVGIEDYELSFPKGAVDSGEDLFQAANRELMEEVGFAARQLTLLRTLTVIPGYLSSEMSILLAQDLYPQQRLGDEPEPLQLQRWPVERMLQLLEEPHFSEARCISALFLAQQFLQRLAVS